MGKLLFWIVIIIAVLWVWPIAARMAARATRARFPRRLPPAQPGGGGRRQRCAHCGIHLPRSEALLQNGRTLCSADHAQRGPANSRQIAPTPHAAAGGK